MPYLYLNEAQPIVTDDARSLAYAASIGVTRGLNAGYLYPGTNLRGWYIPSLQVIDASSGVSSVSGAPVSSGVPVPAPSASQQLATGNSPEPSSVAGTMSSLLQGVFSLSSGTSQASPAAVVSGAVPGGDGQPQPAPSAASPAASSGSGSLWLGLIVVGLVVLWGRRRR